MLQIWHCYTCSWGAVIIIAKTRGEKIPRLASSLMRGLWGCELVWRVSPHAPSQIAVNCMAGLESYSSFVSTDSSLPKEIRTIPKDLRPRTVSGIFVNKYGYLDKNKLYYTDGSWPAHRSLASCIRYTRKTQTIFYALLIIAAGLPDQDFIFTDNLSSFEALKCGGRITPHKNHWDGAHYQRQLN